MESPSPSLSEPAPGWRCPTHSDATANSRTCRGRAVFADSRLGQEPYEILAQAGTLYLDFWNICCRSVNIASKMIPASISIWVNYRLPG